MGFWDVVTGLGKSASNVVSERMKANYWDMWNKIKSSPVDRINDFYNQNNTNDCNRASYRGLAIAALHYRGDWNCARLWREDRDAANWLKSFRVKISLDTSFSADELRRIIDRLAEQG
ncbi:hypothetical protein DFY14_21840 [Escherichia coli]|nr:hypothetical protein [Escherichia coli]